MNQQYHGLQTRFEEYEKEYSERLREAGRKIDLQAISVDEQKHVIAQRDSAVEELTLNIAKLMSEQEASNAEKSAWKDRIIQLENSNSQLDDALKSSAVRWKEADIRIDLLSQEGSDVMGDMAKEVAESHVAIGELQSQISQLLKDKEELQEANRRASLESKSKMSDMSVEAQAALRDRDDQLRNLKSECDHLRGAMIRLEEQVRVGANDSDTDTKGLTEEIRKALQDKELENSELKRRLSSREGEVSLYRGNLEKAVKLVYTEKDRSSELNTDLKKLGDRCQSLAETHGVEKAQWAETETLLRGEVTVLEAQIIQLQSLVNGQQARGDGAGLDAMRSADGEKLYAYYYSALTADIRRPLPRLAQ